MIQEDYCSFEVARLLKDKGFNEDIHTVYEPTFNKFFNYPLKPNSYTNVIAAPTHQMVMKWLREREKLAYSILIIADGNLGDLHYSYEIQEIDNEFLQVNGSLDIEDQRFDTYEEAVEAAVKYALENLI